MSEKRDRQKEYLIGVRAWLNRSPLFDEILVKAEAVRNENKKKIDPAFDPNSQLVKDKIQQLVAESTTEFNGRQDAAKKQMDSYQSQITALESKLKSQQSKTLQVVPANSEPATPATSAKGSVVDDFKALIAIHEQAQTKDKELATQFQSFTESNPIFDDIRLRAAKAAANGQDIAPFKKEFAQELNKKDADIKALTALKNEILRLALTAKDKQYTQSDNKQIKDIRNQLETLETETTDLYTKHIGPFLTFDLKNLKDYGTFERVPQIIKDAQKGLKADSEEIKKTAAKQKADERAKQKQTQDEETAARNAAAAAVDTILKAENAASDADRKAKAATFQNISAAAAAQRKVNEDATKAATTAAAAAVDTILKAENAASDAVRKAKAATFQNISAAAAAQRKVNEDATKAATTAAAAAVDTIFKAENAASDADRKAKLAKLKEISKAATTQRANQAQLQRDLDGLGGRARPQTVNEGAKEQLLEPTSGRSDDDGKVTQPIDEVTVTDMGTGRYRKLLNMLSNGLKPDIKASEITNNDKKQLAKFFDYDVKDINETTFFDNLQNFINAQMNQQKYKDMVYAQLTQQAEALKNSERVGGGKRTRKMTIKPRRPKRKNTQK